jgi:hypothetical protein
MLLASAVVLLQLSAAAPPSPAALLREARRAQVRFENTRRANLPWDRMAGSGTRSECDVVIGRFCYWYDSTETAVVPEPRQITDARLRLLSVLDSAVSVAGSDEHSWIAGQRVRYLVEAGRAADALVAAGDCVGSGWWCASLGGLAFHVAGRYEEADSAFRMALQTMPEKQRCDWHDLERLLDGAAAKRFSKASCADRVTLANRLWNIGQPLWSTPGNDLRTEHFARQTMALILARAANPHGISWGEDSRELLLRYGWAEWFTRRREEMVGLYTGPHVTGHDREPSYHFFPAPRSLDLSDRVQPDDWRLRDELAPSRYAPRHVDRLADLQHQLVRLPRGDSMEVFVRYEVADAQLRADSVAAFLCIARDCARGRARGSLQALVPRSAMTASVELHGDSTRRAARARYSIEGLQCQGGSCLSDLLLFDATNANESDDLAAISVRALTTFDMSNRLPLGVYWELETAETSTGPLLVSLTVSPVRVSLRRRLATRLHLAPPVAPVSLRWQATSSAGIHPRHVTLRLPENARGRYRMTLIIESPRGARLVATRDIELRS